MVGGMCSMLSYGTSICCYAFIYLCVIASVRPFFIHFKKKSGIDKSTEWFTIPAWPSHMCFFLFFFKQGDTEGANSSKNVVFDACVCFVTCKFVSGLILWVWGEFVV